MVQGRGVLAGMAFAAVAATAGAAVVDRTAGPAGNDVIPASAQHAAQAEQSNREALADVEHALHVAQRARRIARVGRGKARTALATANSLIDRVEKALSDASTALTNSNNALDQSETALSQAQRANARLDATRVVSDTVSGVATTSSPTYERDPSSVGPQVTVTVPDSGLIEVWASVHLDDVEGTVGLFEDGQLVTLGDQIGGADCGTDHALLGTTGAGPVSLSTPPSFDGSGLACGTIGNAPAPILLNRPPGTHTYELRYADCGCFGGPSTFSERVIRVAPRL